MLQINYNYEPRQGHLKILINKYSNLMYKKNYADPFNSYIMQANVETNIRNQSLYKWKSKYEIKDMKSKKSKQTMSSLCERIYTVNSI